MKGKTILITGATSGIGKAAVRELVELGHTIVMLIRNLEKGASVRHMPMQSSPTYTLLMSLTGD